MVYVLDIMIISLITIFFYRIIRRTEAMKIAVGLVMIFLIYLIATFIGLEKTAFMFEKIFDVFSIAVFFIFQHEIRLALKKIGGLTNIALHKKMELVTEIEEAVYSMAEKKTGALIIFDPDKKLTQHTENMIEVDAAFSKELLETIFHTNTALHDGAVIIQNNRLAYAGAKLPYSGKKRDGLESRGTRHAVAEEIAELLDVVVVVVSEETGKVSIATSDKGLLKVNNRKMFKAIFKRYEETYTIKDWLKKMKMKKK